MRLLVLVLAGCLNFFKTVPCQELSVVRHSDGDIFNLEGSCTEDCTVLSSGTASLYSRTPSPAGLVQSNNSCTCQCDYALPIFREDLHICVNDIHECNVAGFASNSGQVERVPYVFLPQRGQIIYPHAEIRFEGVSTPVCGIAGAQQLGRVGWSELRNLSNAEPPFRLFRDEGRTFLQWIGEAELKETAEGRVVIVKLVCRDASPNSKLSGVFTPCVSFRVAGSPSKSSVREVMFSATPQSSQGLSATEYTAIGLSSVILAIIYVASVSLYLHSRKAKRKIIEEAEVILTPGREVGGLVKNNPLLAASRHFESDTNSGVMESDLGDDLPQSDGERDFENVTSAIVHPHCVYLEQSEGLFGSGSILGERLPEEDVRVIETADNTHQQDVSVLPGTQRKKLYFNPAYFDHQLLLAPPPAAIEFLLKIREVISIAKHKMAAKKFVPTLTGIPEEENDVERCSSANKNQQPSASSSLPDSVTKSRKSQRCTGCPGCTEFLRNMPPLPEGDQPNPGESKVRAWLEDVRPPQRRWRDTEDARKNFQENTRIFAKNLEYLKELDKRDNNLTGTSLSSWKDNPPMLKTFENIARSEILETVDRQSISKRSTKSMFDEPYYSRYDQRIQSSTFDFGGNDAINAKVRKAIENSFIKQMEENAVFEKRSVKSKDEGKSLRSEIEDSENIIELNKDIKENCSQRVINKLKAPLTPLKKELPDMITELPGGKNTAKRIMDAVIREMVDVKALNNHTRPPNTTDYEVDSLERAKCSRKSSTSPESMDQSSPALSAALPMDEELTMQNAVINTKTGEMTISKLTKDILERNYYNNLPELISPQKSESYSLVSEVYVNDGYASPACSDDSGPEIQYEPENPGHLTIKVQDSPENYVKQDESEYEPDTLDRKPMKLKINDDVNYEKDIPNEIYVDSLERPAQILLKSKGSFRNQDSPKSGTLQRGYGSLREIYEAKLRSNLSDCNLMGSTKSLNGHCEDSLSWKKTKYLTPENRQAKRQRQPQNHPDVVPLPPTEAIYQRPKPPRCVEDGKLCLNSSPSTAKNGWDRNPAGGGDPTTTNGSPVLIGDYNVGKTNYFCPCEVRAEDEIYRRNESVSCSRGKLQTSSDLVVKREKLQHLESCQKLQTCHRTCGQRYSSPWDSLPYQKDNKRLLDQSYVNVASTSNSFEQSQQECPRRNTNSRSDQKCFRVKHSAKGLSKSYEYMNSPMNLPVREHRKQAKVEDSGYLSSTDSNGSHKRLLKHEVSSVSETDETESVFDGASESGAESIGTDSVFFGNFSRLSNVSRFSKSVDSGVDLGVRNSYFQPFGIRNESGAFERTNFSTSDSETESFVTVLPPCGS